MHVDSEEAQKIPTNNVVQILSGSVAYFFKTPLGVAKLDLKASATAGWILVFPGDVPHAQYPSVHKAVVQSFGPAKWTRSRVEEANPWLDAEMLAERG